jgi:hypothetical protein
MRNCSATIKKSDSLAWKIELEHSVCIVVAAGRRMHRDADADAAPGGRECLKQALKSDFDFDGLRRAAEPHRFVALQRVAGGICVWPEIQRTIGAVIGWQARDRPEIKRRRTNTGAASGASRLLVQLEVDH